MAIIGWGGALAVLLPYVLLSLDRLSPTSTWYQGSNVLGSLLLIVNTAYNKSYPSMVVNVVWVCIAAYALLKHLRHRSLAGRSESIDVATIKMTETGNSRS
jgi:hypothetical protein